MFIRSGRSYEILRVAGPAQREGYPPLPPCRAFEPEL